MIYFTYLRVNVTE